MIYRLIQTDSSQLSIRQRCRIAKVSSSAYYSWSNERHSNPAPEEGLLTEVLEILKEFTGYGYRRVTKELKQRGYCVNKKRIQCLMRRHHLGLERKRRFVHTTDSNHGFAIYPNKIRDTVIDQPDQVWASDITYVRLIRGFVYVAVLLDLFSRKVIGWALSRSLHAQLAVEALQMALRTRTVQSGLIHHSDRGVQYACEEYVELLKQHAITISMSRKGNPYDNAKLESFMKTLKTEEVYLNEYETETDARENIGRFIETIYNNKRLHSSLGYCSPNKFEDIFYSHKVA
jgi:transposase InsO family protein